MRRGRNRDKDPLRDPPLQHADLTAVVMGDPPIGRRAIDQRGEAS